MAFNLTKILSGDTVGAAFGKLNSNIDKTFISANTLNQSLRFVSKDGTTETLDLSSLFAPYQTQSATTAAYVHVSGDTMSGPLINSQGGQFRTTMNDDGFRIIENEENDTIFITHNGNITGTKTAEFTNNSGEIIVISGGSALQGVRRNAANTGWDYYTISSGGTSNTFSAGTGLQVSNVGGLVTYTYTGSTSSGGGISGVTTIGTGISIISSITNNNIVQKAISASTYIDIRETTGGTIFIENTLPVTELTTVAGAGFIFPVEIQNLATNEYQFNIKSFSGGTGILVSEDIINKNITISYTGSTSSGGGISGITALGGGIGVLSAITNNNLSYKSLAGAGTVSIAESNGLITISGSSAPSSGITSASNNGSGEQVYQSATTTNLAFRTFSGSNGFSAYTVGNLILFKLQDNTANRVLFNNSGGTAQSSSLLQLDSTGNFFGIGSNSNTTKFLLPSNTNGLVSSMRISKSSINYTGATDGDVWYLNTGNTLKFQKSGTTTDFIFKDNNIQLTGTTGSTRVAEFDSNGTLSASRALVPFGVFNTTTGLTVANSSSEVTIISSSLVGSTLLNSSSAATNQQLVTGKKFRFNARGTISSNAIAPTLRIRSFLGTSAMTDSTAGTLTAALTNQYFEIDLTFTVRSQGSSGKVIGDGKAEFTTGLIAAPQYFNLASLGEITIDTTSNQIFDVKITFGTADPSNSITINESTLEYLN
jgi:hypothetical protein